MNIYFDAADIKTATQKRATLLHFGGTGLQEIFYNIPGANVEPAENAEKDGEGVFKIAIKKLDEHFLPKQSKVYKRHVFRLLRQEKGNIRKISKDQITEKCTSTELRKKILRKGDEITLDKITAEANTLEIVDHQLEDYGNKSKDQEEIKDKNNHVYRNYQNKSDMNKRKCGRCGSSRHSSQDENCPARGKKCHQCDKLGHFRQYCKTQSGQKRKYDDKSNRGNKTQNTKKTRFKNRSETDYVDNEVDQVYYVFHIDDDVSIECKVGGVNINMLIDSVCKLNLITDRTWEILKGRKVKVFNQTSKPNKILYAYGSKTPLTIKGSFEAQTETNGNKATSTIYVITGGTKNLLGKNTAMQLGVLKIGIGINQIESKVEEGPFPKFKDVLVDIPIDDSVQPVSQPYRKTAIPLEGKITGKVKELKARDIIEEVRGPSRWVSPL